MAGVERRLMPQLMGASEIANRLGRSRQRIQQLAERDDFPAPFQDLCMGRVWWAHEVEEWTRRWRAGELPCVREFDDDTVQYLAERVADCLAEQGCAFIDGEPVDVLAEFLRLFLETIGLSLSNDSRH